MTVQKDGVGECSKCGMTTWMFSRGGNQYCGACYDVVFHPWKEPISTVQVADIANLFKVGSRLELGFLASTTECVGTFLDRDYAGIMIMPEGGDRPFFYAWALVAWVRPR